MSRKKVTLEEFARKIKTNDFEWAVNSYLNFIQSGTALSKWLGDKETPILNQNKIVSTIRNKK